MSYEQLAKTYDPRAVEPEIFAQWEKSGAFRADVTDPPTPHEKTFTIVMPPPNVTGALHLGHALNNTLQDILIRYHRMRGFKTLWQPGTDHAGIATQAVVERRIRETEGKTRHELGREELVRRIWAWKDEYEKRILSQLKLMGCSCDWERNRFTLDEGLARAVRQMFFDLFKDGLIFRGKRLVNWDTQLQTAVSDDEVYHETVKGHFYHFKYPVLPPLQGGTQGGSDGATKRRSDEAVDFVLIATTRPETMLGDTAVAVHPDPDGFFRAEESCLRVELEKAAAKERAEIEGKLETLAARRESHLPRLIQLCDMAKAGCKLLLPLVEREIPLICDEWANPTLGTGCVKITPAHDPNDYEVGLRHNLPMINVLSPDGKIARIVEADGSINPHSANYEGLAFSTDGRKKVVADLEARGLVDHIEDRDIELGHSDRSKLPIEPFLSDQWFLSTSEPRASARADVRSLNASKSSKATDLRAIDLSQGATLVTWTTYGTWLPGDQRGYVSRTPRTDGSHELHNLPGEAYDADDAQVLGGAVDRFDGPPVYLTLDHAKIALRSVACTCERHGIELFAVAIMANHIHVLCQGARDKSEVLQLLKGNSSRDLGKQFKLPGAPRWWTKSGSVRFIKKHADLTAAMEYVLAQETPLALWAHDLISGDDFELVESARAEARGSLSGNSHGLAQSAMNAVTDGRIQVFPSRYSKTYLDWLGEKRDWCISRQLWWGHRISVWMQRFKEFDNGSQLQSGTIREVKALGVPSMPGWSDQKKPELIKRWIDEDRIVEYAPQHKLQTIEVDDVSLSYCVRDGNDDREVTETLESMGFAQDHDVLDTWFSSALWPFSTLDWPEKKPILRQHYPGSVLCTSRDIITNWVARMVMFGLYAMGDVPFDHVYVHPKILDGRGETMSKSKGNGVDPVDIIHTHGADALRYSMADLTTETQDIRMPVEYICPHCGKLNDQAVALKNEEQNRKSRGQKLDRKLQPSDCTRVKCSHKDCGKEFATQWADAELKSQMGLGRETSEKFEIGRNFCNKMWNAARFAFMNLEGATVQPLKIAELPPEDRWILARLSRTIRAYHQCLATYQFSASVKELRDFFWDCLCDWYLELSKPRLSSEPRPEGSGFSESRSVPKGFSEPRQPWSGSSDGQPDGSDSSASTPVDVDSRRVAQQVLALCVDHCMRLWHPTTPFITERLWSQLNHVAPKRGIPGAAELRIDPLLITSDFPPVEGYPALEDEGILTTFAELQDAVRGVRDLRNRCNVTPKQKVRVTVVAPAARMADFRAHAHIVQHMAGIGELSVASEGKRPANAGSVTIGGLRIFVHDISDDAAERVRAKKELEATEKQIAGKQARLGNASFVAGAAAEIVEAERSRLAELVAQRDSLTQHLAELAD